MHHVQHCRFFRIRFFMRYRRMAKAIFIFHVPKTTFANTFCTLNIEQAFINLFPIIQLMAMQK